MTIEQFIASLSKERREQLHLYIQEAVYAFSDCTSDFVCLMHLVDEQLNR